MDGLAAIKFVNDSLIPMFDAHGGLTPDCWGVVVCDGVGTHMTLAFLEHCEKNYIAVVLRTPNCSSKQQFEDLVCHMPNSWTPRKLLTVHVTVRPG